ncbi:MAG: AbrB/MazE/SpoVT family DNA-binding domain-containing protein [Candidatus Freyrarchaeum guaymaensis]
MRSLFPSIRRELGIKEGDYVSIEVSGEGEAVLKRVIPIEELAGAWDEEMNSVMKEVRQAWRRWKL